ncbi:MAG: hypothetical protein LCH54_08370 [Bacteroidetes bacterium]|nr:hypothetical protein [Bacteroidota bacterium]
MIQGKLILKFGLAGVVLLLVVMSVYSFLKTESDLDAALELVNKSRTVISESNQLLSEQKKVIDELTTRNDGLGRKLQTIDSLNSAIMKKLDTELKSADSGLKQLKSVINHADELEIPE